MLVGGSHFTVLATVIFAVVFLAEGAGAAGSCGDMALEIAMSSKLESGGLSKDGTFISLTGDPYGAYLYCSGPAGMTLVMPAIRRLVCLCEQNRQRTDQTSPTDRQIGGRALHCNARPPI